MEHVYLSSHSLKIDAPPCMDGVLEYQVGVLLQHDNQSHESCPRLVLTPARMPHLFQDATLKIELSQVVVRQKCDGWK